MKENREKDRSTGDRSTDDGAADGVESVTQRERDNTRQKRVLFTSHETFVTNPKISSTDLTFHRWNSQDTDVSVPWEKPEEKFKTSLSRIGILLLLYAISRHFNFEMLIPWLLFEMRNSDSRNGPRVLTIDNDRNVNRDILRLAPPFVI